MQLDALHGLIDERNAAAPGDARARIDARIDAAFGRDVAVLISDMSGFSRVTRSRGIVHILSMIRRMQVLCRPIIEANGGRMVKCEADNLFCGFATPRAALQAAIEMREAVRRDALDREDDDRIGLSIGIGWGRVLDIDGQDLFGDAVNMASKLGEDIAQEGEILLTDSAVAAVQTSSQRSFQPCETETSRCRLSYFRLIE
jgi:class 3 adenylate cyclase